MITQEQLKEIQERRDALKRYLDIDNKRIQVEEEELRTHVPDFWEHPKEAQLQMKKIKDLQAWIKGYEKNQTVIAGKRKARRSQVNSSRGLCRSSRNASPRAATTGSSTLAVIWNPMTPTQKAT